MNDFIVGLAWTVIFFEIACRWMLDMSFIEQVIMILQQIV